MNNFFYISKQIHIQDVFFEICDFDGCGAISEQELYNVLKLNIASFRDRQKLKKQFQKYLLIYYFNGDGQLDKQEILETAKKILTKLIICDNDLHDNFHEWIQASANFVNYLEGIFYPSIDKLLKQFKEMEEEYYDIAGYQFIYLMTYSLQLFSNYQLEMEMNIKFFLTQQCEDFKEVVGFR